MIVSPFVLQSFMEEGKYIPYWKGRRGPGCSNGWEKIWWHTKCFMRRKWEDWDFKNYSERYKFYLLRLREYEVMSDWLLNNYYYLAQHERERLDVLPTKPMELFADGVVIRNWLATLGRGESYWS